MTDKNIHELLDLIKTKSLQYHQIKETKKFEYDMQQIIGKRDYQQDTIIGGLSLVTNKFCACLSDGMGGLVDGQVASKLSANLMIEELFNNNEDLFTKTFEENVIKIDDLVCEYSLSVYGKLDIGATLIGMTIVDNCLYYGSVGDSRIFVYRSGKLYSLNKEHNYGLIIDEQLEKDEISQNEWKKKNSERNKLISYVGKGNITLIDSSQSPLILLPGDIVIMCSDGLTNALTLEEISALLSILKPKASIICDCLIKQVEEKNLNYQDNTSIIIFIYKE